MLHCLFSKEEQYAAMLSLLQKLMVNGNAPGQGL